MEGRGVMSVMSVTGVSGLTPSSSSAWQAGSPKL